MACSATPRATTTCAGPGPSPWQHLRPSSSGDNDKFFGFGEPELPNRNGTQVRFARVSPREGIRRGRPRRPAVERPRNPNQLHGTSARKSFGSHQRSSGPVMAVVASAISTSMVKSG